MNRQRFIEHVVKLSRAMGFRIETNRNGQTQINFGHKKLHSGHLEQLYPEILDPDANVASLINSVAPGRPCTHKPMRKIIGQIVEIS